ncbi:type IV pilus assembly protein PilM [Demequina sp.]|uniref:type IV pilus assembly protein PilM n=1 Tax=Demequina sp. TaxID=2050685 RepID=UPI0025C6D8E3|nr:type IV pilus assembly protein PilM [Demequina sp.]
MAIHRLGLDLGSTHVQLAEVEFANKNDMATGTGILTGFAQVTIPRGSLEGGEVVDVGAVATAIRNAVSIVSPKTKDVIIGVGAESVVVREIELPEMPMAQLRSSLPFQVQDVLPMSIDESVLDFYPTGTLEGASASTLRGILVAAPKALVSQNLLAVDAAGLKTVGVDINAFALIRAQLAGDLSSRVVAFVDIGAQMTNIVICQAGQPRLVRTLSSGGHKATDAVATALRIDAQQAEQIKFNIGMEPPSDRELVPAHDAIAASARSLVDAVRNTFVYYSSNNHGEAIERVVITGGGAHLRGLGQHLATASRLPVTFGNSFARVTIGSKLGADAVRGFEANVPVAVGLTFGEAA